jgi:hypothetical protein
MTDENARLVVYGTVVLVGVTILGVASAVNYLEIRRIRKRTQEQLVKSAETFLACEAILNPPELEESWDFLDELEKKLKK